MEAEGSPSSYFGDAVGEIPADPKISRHCFDSNALPPAASGCFDCNICLDSAVDPVVTLCGHLYCWPCIFKWLQIDETKNPQQCPVCKASITDKSLVPLYGRGCNSNPKKSYPSLKIPCRPSVPRDHGLISSDTETLLPTAEELHIAAVQSTMQEDFSPRLIHSTAGELLGGMAFAVLPWAFRDHQDQYQYAGSPRLRRHEVEVERSLRQIWLFLLCCAVLCLLIF